MMLRNLLLLLEATPSGQVARTLACDIAAMGNWHLTALQIQETESAVFGDNLVVSPHSLFQEEFGDFHQYDAQSVPDAMEEEVFADLHLDYETKIVAGPRYAMLSQELEKNDLTIIGRDGNFAGQGAHNAKEIINLLLDYRARPLIITPPHTPPASRNALITYDGSPGSSRAAQFFVLTGLAQQYTVHALSISRKKKVAQARIDILAKYLQKHGIEVVPCAIESHATPQEIITTSIDDSCSSLVVAGAFGASNWRSNTFGSVSEHLLRHCPVPLFSCQ